MIPSHFTAFACLLKLLGCSQQLPVSGEVPLQLAPAEIEATSKY
jgi:hypothetical protein